MERSLVVLLCAFGVAQSALAQLGEWKISLGARATYTSTSKIFYNPEAPSADARSQHLALDHVFGGGIDIRVRHADDDFFIILSAEYLSKLQLQSQFVALSNPPLRVQVKDGFSLIPIELGGYVYIPVGSEKIRLAMGGGIGVYVAQRILNVAGVEAVMEETPVGYGIHVESLADYRILPWLLVQGQMRFRDPEVVTTSRYALSAVQHGDGTLVFPQDSFKTKINVDGISLGLGIVVDLF